MWKVGFARLVSIISKPNGFSGIALATKGLDVSNAIRSATTKRDNVVGSQHDVGFLFAAAQAAMTVPVFQLIPFSNGVGSFSMVKPRSSGMAFDSDTLTIASFP
jgi:hypothetical protein